MKKVNKILKAIGLKPILIDETCFITPDKELIYSIYVDNFQYFSNSQLRIEKLKQLLSENFKIKLYSHISHYLGVDVNYH
jgi:hypothetical protein